MPKKWQINIVTAIVTPICKVPPTNMYLAVAVSLSKVNSIPIAKSKSKQPNSVRRLTASALA